MLKLRRKPKKLALLLLVTAILVICTILILGNFFTAHALPFSTPNTITLPVGATGADLQATLDSILPGAANATTVIIQNDIITDQTLYLASQPPSHIPQYVILQGEHTITATMDAPAIRAVYATRFVLNGPTITRTNSGANSRGIVTHNMAFYFMAGEISGHSVDGHGAGVYGGGRVVMHGGSIINNTATGNGGGMHLYADVNSQWSFGVGTHHIYDGIIGNNNAYGNGGGISTYTLLIMEGGNIIGNVAHGDGGGFHTNRYDWMWIRIYGGSISYNTAHGNGGGAVLVGFDSWGPFIENDVTIHNNTAHGNGGGLWVTTAQREAGDIGSIHVQNVTSTLLYGNVAHGDGGGIWIDEQTTLVLNSFSNTLIKNNTAHGDGGG
ncbi:MAG: hypothetical protein FWB93_06420, partial [Oscillospiraceae bacterium]|nr:hypothetical protein [Oscillospiraceae bacterium]